MGREFRLYEPDQSYLLPPSLREWLPEDHLAFFVSDAVDAMELSAFVARYGEEGPGNQAFDPRMMVKVLLYAYASGTFSSWGQRMTGNLPGQVSFRGGIVARARETDRYPGRFPVIVCLSLTRARLRRSLTCTRT